LAATKVDEISNNSKAGKIRTIMMLEAPGVAVTSAAQLTIRKLPPPPLDRKDFIYSHKV
jgi:hypothetical protein